MLPLEQAPCIRQGCARPLDSSRCEKKPREPDVKCHRCCRAWVRAWPLMMCVVEHFAVKEVTWLLTSRSPLQCEKPCSLEVMSKFGAWAAALQKGIADRSESQHIRRAVDPAQVSYMLLQLRSLKTYTHILQVAARYPSKSQH